MKMVEVWETDDGKTFKSITEARAHEECQKYLPEIEAFLASGVCKYNNIPQKTVAKNVILAWIFWKADGGTQ